MIPESKKVLFFSVLNPRGRGLITRSGNGRFVLMYKSKSGSVEEWRISFNKWGMIMVHIEPRIKQQYLSENYIKLKLLLSYYLGS